jgi:hypothetical protein
VPRDTSPAISTKRSADTEIPTLCAVGFAATNEPIDRWCIASSIVLSSADLHKSIRDQTPEPGTPESNTHGFCASTSFAVRWVSAAPDQQLVIAETKRVHHRPSPTAESNYLKRGSIDNNTISTTRNVTVTWGQITIATGTICSECAYSDTSHERN